MKFKGFVITLLLIPVLMACSANVSLTFDENYSYLTVTMTDEDLEATIERLLTSGQSRLRNVSAEAQTGSIYVTADAPTNNGLQSGNLTVEIGSQNGILDVEVTSFNFAGYTAEQAGINNFNQRLADNLARNARDRENDSEFTDVTVRPDEFSFTIRTPRRN
ncbi:MAG: hypothetical protein AAFV93_05470 [Chloroflexota bacterium]